MDLLRYLLLRPLTILAIIGAVSLSSSLLYYLSLPTLLPSNTELPQTTLEHFQSSRRLVVVVFFIAFHFSLRFPLPSRTFSLFTTLTLSLTFLFFPFSFPSPACFIVEESREGEISPGPSFSNHQPTWFTISPNQHQPPLQYNIDIALDLTKVREQTTADQFGLI